MINQLDLFAGSRDITVSTPSIATPATLTKSIYRVELMPDSSTRITDHGHVTFHGMIRRAKA